MLQKEQWISQKQQFLKFHKLTYHKRNKSNHKNYRLNRQNSVEYVLSQTPKSADGQTVHRTVWGYAAGQKPLRVNPVPKARLRYRNRRIRHEKEI